MSNFRKEAVNRGPQAKLRIVWGLASNGRYLGEEFFDEECQEDQRSKFNATFNIVADQGHVRATKLYRYPLKHCGDIGEFKTFKKRLFFYREGNDLIITHGATKKTGDTDPNDIERVKRIRREIEEAEKKEKDEQLRRGTIHHSQRGGLQ